MAFAFLAYEPRRLPPATSSCWTTCWRTSQRQFAEQGAQLRFLPPYSPDLNPIEVAFSKLKALLKAAARTLDELRQAIADALPS